MKRLTRTRILALTGSLALPVGMLLRYLHGSNTEAQEFMRHLDQSSNTGPDVTPPPPQTSEQMAAHVAAIQAIYNKHNEAWCDGDGQAFASVFTEDSDFISFDGGHRIGRAAIASSHQELFDTFLNNTCLAGNITRIKFVNDGVALVYVTSGTRFGSGDRVRRPSIQTYLAVRQDNDWRFATFHNGRIDRVEDRSFVRLAWLGIETVVFRR